MTTFLLIAVGVVAAFVLLLFGAVVELHRQVLQLRVYAGLVDHARTLEFNEECRLSDLPIPAAGVVGDRERSAVLVLSDGCATCMDVATRMSALSVPRLLVLVESATPAMAADWLEAHGLALGDTVAYDENGLAALYLGVSVTPAAVKFEGRLPIAAATVPSARQLERVADWVNGTSDIAGVQFEEASTTHEPTT